MKKNSLYILLDVLFEEKHYERIVERRIENELLLTEGENLFVNLPSVDCILGDKLTAFCAIHNWNSTPEKEEYGGHQAVL